MKESSGAFLVSRSIFDSAIFLLKPAEWLKIWIYILGRVNYRESRLIDRGEGLFSYEQIQSACKVSRGQVDKCLKYLRNESKVSTRRSTRHFFVKVLNYEKYQDIGNYRIDDKIDRASIDDRQRSDRESTRYKNKETSNKKINNNTSTKKSSLSRVQKKREDVFSEHSLKLAEIFFSFAGRRFLELCPQFKDESEVLENWAEEIEKLHRIDDLDFSQIEFLINWLFTSDSENALFWRKQIASPSKFRRKNKDGSPYWRVLVDRMRQEAEQFSIETREYSL